MIKILIYLIKNISGNLRGKIIGLQFLISVNSVAQLISILSIAPLVSILSNHNLDIYEILRPILDFINIDLNSEKKDLIIDFSLFVLFIFTLSNILTAITYALQQKISMQFEVELSKIIVEKFFYQEQDVGVKKNSYYFKSIVEKEIPNVISHAIIPLCDLNSKVFPLILILISILIIDPFISMIVFLFLGIGYASVYLLIKKKLNRNSILISNYLSDNTIIVDDLFKSFKESKIFNFEKFLIDSYVVFKKKITKHIGSNLILNGSPKHFFEIIAIFIVVIIIIIFALRSDFSSSLPIISVYVVAGYRIMPGLQSILFAVSNIKGSEKSLKNLYQTMILKNQKIIKINNIDEINKISFKKFSFKYNKKIIFEKSNIEFKKNTISGLRGESGIGKSTLIDLIVGFKKISKGSFYINDRKIIHKNNRIFEHVSIVPQSIFLLNDSVVANITFQKKLNKVNYTKLLSILKILKLTTLYKQNKIINKTIKEFGKNLSGGQIQRIGLARALYKDSKIIILDEFTSALDEKTEKSIFKNLNKYFKDKIIIIISHRNYLLRKCDVVYSIRNNKIINHNYYSKKV